MIGHRPVRVVLASASPRRLDVLRQLGLDPEVVPADLDETVHPGEAPAAYVERLARAKADEVAGREAGLIVAGDTIVVADERILAKPESPGQAVEMLVGLSGRVHEVVTAVAVAFEGRRASGLQRTSVGMRAYTAATVRAYVETGEPMDKAGGYGIQGQGAALVDRIEGDYYTVVGLPVALTLTLLDDVGCQFHFTGITAPVYRSSSEREPS